MISQQRTCVNVMIGKGRSRAAPANANVRWMCRLSNLHGGTKPQVNSKAVGDRLWRLNAKLGLQVHLATSGQAGPQSGSLPGYRQIEELVRQRQKAGEWKKALDARCGHLLHLASRCC